MRYSPALAVLLLAGASMSAQPNAGSPATVLPVLSAGQGCPVNFSAQRQAGLAVRSVRDGQGKIDGQGLTITFQQLYTPKIAGVSVTVHGTSGQTASMITNSGLQGDVSESFTLKRDAPASSLSNSAIWTRKVKAIRWLELTKIEYADGSQWEPSKESRCRVQPGLLVFTS
jgi:hypothetical protein